MGALLSRLDDVKHRDLNHTINLTAQSWVASTGVCDDDLAIKDHAAEGRLGELLEEKPGRSDSIILMLSRKAER